MSDDGVDSYSVKGLEMLVKALKRKPPTCRVGILGDDGARTAKIEGPRQEHQSTPPTNAEIGAAHEFGTAHIPMRSFLRVPIAEGLEKEMDRSGLFDSNVMKEVIKSGSVRPWMEKVAVCAEAVVQDAFNTGGNGKWPAWKNSKYSNNAGQLLVDTGQLQKSITSEVKGS